MVSVEISGKQVLIRAHQRKTCPEVHAEGSAVKKVFGFSSVPPGLRGGFCFWFELWLRYAVSFAVALGFPSCSFVTSVVKGFWLRPTQANEEPGLLACF